MENSKIYYADIRGDAKSCRYPHCADLLDREQLREALQYDYTPVKFQQNYRHSANFIHATAVGFDIDNDGSDNEEEWVTPEDLLAMMPDVSCVVIFSRHHMLPKMHNSEMKSPRPRYHILFPIEEITDKEAYGSLKKRFAKAFPFVDPAALDISRMFFGTEKPDFFIREGSRTVCDFLSEAGEASVEVIPAPPREFFLREGSDTGRAIPVGERNTTMHQYALVVLKRLGNTKKAYELFLERSYDCEVPLPAEELRGIWKSAAKYYAETILPSPDYLPPEIYEAQLSPVPVQWEIPRPLDDYELPEFPVHALPVTIRDYVTAVSLETQTPADMAAGFSLALLGLCNQKKYCVLGKPGWSEPLSLYILIVASPSERKSAIVKKMTEPLVSYQKSYNEEHSAAFLMVRNEQKKIEQEIAAISKKPKKKKTPDAASGTPETAGAAREEARTEPVTEEETLDCFEKLQTLSMRLKDLKKIHPMRLFIDDVTSEMLSSVMAENDEKIAVISSEGDVFGNLADRYTSNPNLGIWLKAFSGDMHVVDRISRGTETMYAPALTIGITSQPATLAEIMGNKTLNARGFTARFLYSLPKSLVGSRLFDTPAIPEDVRSAYRNTILNMLRAEACEEPEEIRLSPEADAVFRDFYGETERKLLTEYAGFEGWAGKLNGTVLRIAGNLCVASAMADSGKDLFSEPLVISGEIMRNAIEIARYYVEHAKRAFSPFCDNSVLQIAQKGLFFIRRDALTSFTLREMTTHFPTEKQKKEVLLPVLQLLTDRGFLAPDEEPRRKQGPAGPRYLVNPLLLQQAA